MTFQQIKFVLEIARCGSISKATKNLYVAQSYLSITLKALEEELGIVIFTRNVRGVELTDNGKEFISYVRPLLDQRDKIMEMYKKEDRGSLFHFNISTQRYPFVMKSVIEFFHEQNPDKYEVHIREAGMHRVIDDIYEKRSDFGIIFISPLTETFIKRVLTSKEIDYHSIVQVTPCVFFNKNHPMAKSEQISISDMEEYPYASFEESSSISMDFSEEMLLYGFTPPQKRFFVSDRASMINVLTHTTAFSIGTGILPKGFAGPSLTSRPIANYKNSITLMWIKRKDVVLNNHATAFTETIKEKIHSL